MPSRLWTVIIVAFWLAASAWLFSRDLWPRLRPGEPPPFVIDLVDEARRTAPRIRWVIRRGDRQIGTLRTWVEYHDPTDTFELHGELKQLNLDGIPGHRVQAPEVTGMYRVTREGELREMVAAGELQVSGVLFNAKLSGHFHGQVRDRRFQPEAYVVLGDVKHPLDLPPVPVSGRGSVLNPMHPLNRIRGLRPGQQWTMPVVDPLGDFLSALQKGQPKDRVLQAQVLPETKLLTWNGREWQCLVIEYEGDDRSARTWLRVEDGLVLRQEATMYGERLVMERE